MYIADIGVKIKQVSIHTDSVWYMNHRGGLKSWGKIICSPDKMNWDDVGKYKYWC